VNPVNPVNPVPIVRYAFRERLIHAVSGLSFVYLLLTGLAFWTPGLYWLAVMLGGGFLSRVLHPWIGLVFAGAVLAMAGGWWSDMRITADDKRWRRAMGRYIRNEDASVPPAGRFNYGQKMLFWVMLWSGLVLLASGLVMWFVPVASMPLRTVAPLVHAIAALVTIGAFIVHVYMGIAVVPGGLHAIIHGDVSEPWARHHHPAWRRPS
jgi:formate dehydrogenase subunit gamma